jgi:hypothetical protein
MDLQLARLDWADEFDEANNESNSDSGSAKIVTGRKSVWKAGLLSALVPGAGEYYVGSRHKARYFFAAEALTWIGFASFKIYAGWKEDDYINLAATRANAQLEGKSDAFHDFVGFYNSIDDYNTAGRIIEPDRPYLPDTPENHWRWESQEDRLDYRQLKNRSREADRRADFMIGVAVVTRLISIVDAIRDAGRVNREIDTFSEENNKTFKFSVNPFQSRNQIQLTMLTGF